MSYKLPPGLYLDSPLFFMVKNCYNFFMDAKKFVKTMLGGSIFFGVIFLGTLLFTNPNQGFAVKIVFFMSLFVFTFCLTALLLYLIKKRLTNNELYYLIIKNSTRQGLLFSVFTILSLLLALFRLLTWWDFLLLAFSLILLELYFKSGKQ